jgi:glycosyltransferase involved in cell wall biosynthesis
LLVSRPRLLFVSPRFLFPLDEGGKIRTVGILRAMKGGAFDITLVSPAPANLADFKEELRTVADRFVSWAPTKPGFLAKMFGVLGSLPVSTLSDQSAAGRDVVQDQIAVGADVVVADFPHSDVLLPQKLSIPSVMFTHNIEAEILERHADVAKGWRRLVWQREARKMARFERLVLRKFSSVVAVSAKDESALRDRYRISNVHRIDTGVDLDFYPYQAPRPRAEVVVFSGAMDSRSNIDGIVFLLREVWPIVAAARPAVRVRIVGRNPPAALVAEAGVAFRTWRFTGFVDDIRPSLQAGDISVIPLRVGSGTRLKAFEAMAIGLPVVSTTLGVEGLGLSPGTHYLAADRADTFAQAIIKLVDDEAERTRLAETGRALLEARYSWAVIGRQFEQICRKAREAVLF